MSENRPWDEAFTRSRAAKWDVRARAAEELGSHLDQREVRDRLQELLDDEDTAVGAVAARQLVLQGGPGGLVIVAEAFAYGDEQAGYHIGDAMADLRTAGFPIDSAIRTLLRTAPDDRAREAARQLMEYLGVD